MSQDLGQFLLSKTDIIIESWIAAIREDADVESSKVISDKEGTIFTIENVILLKG